MNSSSAAPEERPSRFGTTPFDGRPFRAATNQAPEHVSISGVCAPGYKRSPLRGCNSGIDLEGGELSALTLVLEPCLAGTLSDQPSGMEHKIELKNLKSKCGR